jgi:uncharacterized membrane protein YoaK (UPF0700 family)
MKVEDTIPFTTRSRAAFLMAAIAGFIDVITFIGANHLFSAHITGNIVIAISEIVNHKNGVLSKVISIPLFIFFAFFMTLSIHRLGKSARILRAWLIAEALLLMAFMYGGIYFLSTYSVDSWQYIAAGMIAVCAMAIHNTLMRTYMTTLPPVTVMTGNLTQFTVDFANLMLTRNKSNLHEKHKAARNGIERYGNVLLGFVVGGACAAVGFCWVSFWTVLLAVITIFVMAGQIK